MVDLWPDGIEHISVKPPVAILREQGTLLGKKTSNIVEGGVVSVAAPESNRFEHIFYLASKALDYRYELLRISHSIDMYPLDINPDEDVYLELPFEIRQQIENLAVDSEDSFMEILKAIFATEKVRKIIGAIMSLSSAGIQI